MPMTVRDMCRAFAKTPQVFDEVTRTPKKSGGAVSVRRYGDRGLLTLFSDNLPIAQWKDGIIYIRQSWNTVTTQKHINIVAGAAIHRLIQPVPPTASFAFFERNATED